MISTESTKYLNKLQTILESHGNGETSNKLEAVFKDACNELKRMGSRKIGGKPLREILLTATMKEYAELVEMFGPLFVFDRCLGRNNKGDIIPICKIKMIKAFPAIIIIELIRMTEDWFLLGDYSPEKKILFKIEIADEASREFKSAFRTFIGYFSLLPQFINWIDFKIKLSEKQTAILKDETIIETKEAEQVEESLPQDDLILYKNKQANFSVLVNKNDIIKVASDYPNGQSLEGFLFMVKEKSGFAYSFLCGESFSGKDFTKTKKYLSGIKPRNNIIAISKQYIEEINKIPTLSFSFIIKRENRFEMVFYNFMQFKDKVVNLMVQTMLDEENLDEIKQLYIKHPLLLSVKKIIERISYSKEEKKQPQNKPQKTKTYVCEEYGFSITIPQKNTVKNTAEAIKAGHHKDTIFVIEEGKGFFCRVLYEGPCNRNPFETAESMIEVIKNSPNTNKSSEAVKNIINGIEVISFSYCTNNPKNNNTMMTSLNFVRIRNFLINFTSNFFCNDTSQINVLLKNPVYPKIIRYIKGLTIEQDMKGEEGQETQAQINDPLVIANTKILRYLVYKERLDINEGNNFINKLMEHQDLYEEFKNSIKGYNFTVSVENQVTIEGQTALSLFCLDMSSPSEIYNQLIMLRENSEQNISVSPK